MDIDSPAIIATVDHDAECRRLGDEIPSAFQLERLSAWRATRAES